MYAAAPSSAHWPHDVPPPLDPALPAWAMAALGGARAQEWPGPGDGLGPLVETSTGALSHFLVTVPEARALSSDGIRARVRRAYLALFEALDSRAVAPVRFWNFIPGIGDVLNDGLDRYMAFNAGRYDAYVQTVGLDRLAQSATASGVGYEGSAIVVHALGVPGGGTALENPRQVPSYRYSPAYGPLPPCFARATRTSVHGRRVLLIGGTASVCGEDTRHVDDLAAQTGETLRNLTALVALEAPQSPLAHLRHLRVYLRRPESYRLVQGLCEGEFIGLESLEVRAAAICRPELLVEIEGVAVLPDAPAAEDASGARRSDIGERQRT